MQTLPAGLMQPAFETVGTLALPSRRRDHLSRLPTPATFAEFVRPSVGPFKTDQQRPVFGPPGDSTDGRWGRSIESPPTTWSCNEDGKAHRISRAERREQFLIGSIDMFRRDSGAK
jgi:hypothetical protein